MDTILVTIPGASASTSKMSKKGWKCWAKVLSGVKEPANDGYAYAGEFASIGTSSEQEIGSVILQVDQSETASVGVVLKNRAGKGMIKWLANANSEGRKWCGPLGKPTRKLLAMTNEERVRHAAALIAAETDEQRKERGVDPMGTEVRAYWQQLAAADARQQAIASIRQLMVQHGITSAEIDPVK